MTTTILALPIFSALSAGTFGRLFGRYGSMVVTTVNMWPANLNEKRASDYLVFASSGLLIAYMKNPPVLPIPAVTGANLGPVFELVWKQPTRVIDLITFARVCDFIKDCSVSQYLGSDLAFGNELLLTVQDSLRGLNMCLVTPIPDAWIQNLTVDELKRWGQFGEAYKYAVDASPRLKLIDVYHPWGMKNLSALQRLL